MPQIKEFKYFSHILGRDIAVEVTGHWGYPVIMFPTSYGSYVQNRDFGLNDSVSKYVEEGKIKLYNIQTLDGETFYASHLNGEQRIYNYDLYMQFFIKEFTPFIQKENNTHRFAVAGCSFGGYHAANVAFRFPDVISHLFSMSGAFSIRNFIPGSTNDKVYFNCPDEFMRNEESWKYHHMKIILGTSEWDICKDKNQAMAALLSAKGIPHRYDEKKWAEHDWPLWKMAFPEYIHSCFGS